MYCKRCGKELVEGTKYCPECGENNEVVEAEVVDSVCETPQVNKPHVARCFTIFAKIGYGLGIATFICSFIPFVCLFSLSAGEVSLVFSILGRKDPEMRSKAKKGLVFSILGLAISFIVWIITCVIMGLAGADLYY